MTNHTPMPKVSRLEVISTGARRRWTLEEKQRIVAESFSASRVVSATARRHGLSASQLFNWRRLARSGELIERGAAAGFAPAIIAAEPLVPASPASSSQALAMRAGAAALAPSRMEIVLSGARVIVGPDVDVAALKRVLAVLDPR